MHHHEPQESCRVRSFFPRPSIFISAVLDGLVMTIWFTAGSLIEPYLSLGPWLGCSY